MYICTLEIWSYKEDLYKEREHENSILGLGAVAHACNPSILGG